MKMQMNKIEIDLTRLREINMEEDKVNSRKEIPKALTLMTPTLMESVDNHIEGNLILHQEIDQDKEITDSKEEDMLEVSTEITETQEITGIIEIIETREMTDNKVIIIEITEIREIRGIKEITEEIETTEMIKEEINRIQAVDLEVGFMTETKVDLHTKTIPRLTTNPIR